VENVEFVPEPPAKPLVLATPPVPTVIVYDVPTVIDVEFANNPPAPPPPPY
jgi:hypothetical protein